MDPDEAFLRHVIMTLVSDHDGRYGWYQLARYVFAYQVEPRPPAMAVAGWLIGEDRLRTAPAPDGGSTRYWITPAGQDYLRSLDEANGALLMLGDQGWSLVERA